MKTFTPADAWTLGEALVDAFPSPSDLDLLLASDGIARRLNHFASDREAPLKAAREIAIAAIDGGWAMVLFEKAREKNPGNVALRRFWEALPDRSAVEAPLASAKLQFEKPSLPCGRASQWAGVELCASTPNHYVILVAGQEGQAPMHFRERIRVHLKAPPPKQVCIVDWKTRPVSRPQFFAELGLALEMPPATHGDEKALQDEFARRLAGQNLILLHPLIDVKHQDQRIVSYYTEWLPALLPTNAQAANLKCVQPIEWRDGGGVSLLKRLLAGGQSSPRDEARELMETLEKKIEAIPHVLLLRLDELTDLSDADLSLFAKGKGLRRPQQDRLMKELAECEPVPKEIFNTIDACWYEVVGNP